MMDSMTALELAGLVLSFEFALIACVLPAWLLRGRSRQSAVEQADARDMLETVEQGEPSRREALSTIFESTYQLEEDELESRVDEFIAREQAFYQVMTSVYLERDSSRLKEIPAELTKVISPWIRMTPQGGGDADADAVANLAEANNELSAELERTRQSMDELMQEYLKAFDKEGRTPPKEMAALAAEEAAQAADESADTAAADGGEGAVAADDDTDDLVFDVAEDEPESDVDPASSDASADDDDELVFDVAEDLPDEPVASDPQVNDDTELVFDVAEDAPEDKATTTAAPHDDGAPEEESEAAMSQDEIDALANLFDEEIAALDGDPDGEDTDKAAAA